MRTNFEQKYFSHTFCLHLLPRSRMRAAIPPLSLYIFLALYLVKHRDYFTFTFTITCAVACNPYLKDSRRFFIIFRDCRDATVQTKQFRKEIRKRNYYRCIRSLLCVKILPWGKASRYFDNFQLVPRLYHIM